MPYFWRVISSKRTVLKAVVRAPMQPTLKRFMPLTTRQMAAKSRRFCSNALLSGWTTWGFNTVNGTPYWVNTSVTENLPQKASRRCLKSILPISSGYACIKIGTPASCRAVMAPFSSANIGME